MKFALGKKLNMTQLWKEDKVMPVTELEVGPCIVTQLFEGKVQIGFDKLPDKKVKKSQKVAPYRFVREFFTDQEYKVGDQIEASMFEEGEEVKISGFSKGKGFQGGVKRHGFHGFGSGHGVKHGERKIGSIGSAWPQRVIKGRKMPGRMGSDRITVKNLKIVKIDKNRIFVKGAVPGKPGTYLELRV